MVGLPDRAHGVVGVLAQRAVALAAAAEQLPEAGAEVGAGEHGVGREPDEHEDDGSLSQLTSRLSVARLRQLERRAREAAQQPRRRATASPA